MPQLDLDLQKAVFFLYAADPLQSQGLEPLGTGIMIGMPSTKNPVHAPAHVYAITAGHVPDRYSRMYIRLSTSIGTDTMEIEPNEWVQAKNGSDIAAAEITDKLNGRVSEAKIYCLKEWLIPGKEIVEAKRIGSGENAFILGLFSPIPGKAQNTVAARFGNVSLMADDDQPIAQGNGQERPSHILDLKSRNGFSGSPVFVYRTPFDDLRETGGLRSTAIFNMFGGSVGDGYPVLEHAIKNTFLHFFGIHSSQFHDFSEAIQLADDGSSEGRLKLKLPNSLTVVVPAWEVIALLDEAEFQSKREEREQKVQTVTHWCFVG